MRRAVLCLALLFVTACATGPTPYQPRPQDGRHGYSEQALEPDRVRVVFRGNFLTPQETVENYLLYRAAEVTLERGYRFFVPSLHRVEEDRPHQTVVTGIATGFGWHGDPFGTSLIIVDRVPAQGGESYRASAVFKLLQEAPAQHAIDAFDARSVLETLGPSILRPSEGAPTASTS
ncbi:MAG: CC0125/CC1285 family lipoprotein [Algiphilus sp.]